jgi:hypothetical protein
MKSAVGKILKAHGILEAFNSTDHYAVKIASVGFMPLCIEKHGELLTVTHYFEQNGDLVPDPDVEFVNIGGKEWLPVAIQHSTGHYSRVAERIEGVWKFRPRGLRDLQSFSRMWARNLLAQGFATGELVRHQAG